MGKSEIKYLTLSQEDLVNAGAFDLRMAIEALIVTATSTHQEGCLL